LSEADRIRRFERLRRELTFSVRRDAVLIDQDHVGEDTRKLRRERAFFLGVAGDELQSSTGWPLGFTTFSLP